MPDFTYMNAIAPDQSVGQQAGMLQQAAEQQPGLMQMVQGGAAAPDWIQNTGGYSPEQLPSWYNPANWGPAPPPGEYGRGAWGPNDPGGKFWTGRDQMMQYHKKYGGALPEVMDDRPNTRNWRLLGNEPGNYMTMGHLIGMGKLREDLTRGQNPDGGEGASNWSPIRSVPGMQLGPEYPAVFAHGSTARVGIPGQLDPWAIGMEGPG
jgi:hypothetical protein